MKKIFNYLILLVLLIPIKVFATGSITVSPSTLTIEEGKSKTFTITAYNTVADISISSSDTNIAILDINAWETGILEENSTVTKEITVTGIKAGTATITIVLNDAATFDYENLTGQTKTVTINVSEPVVNTDSGTIAVSGLSISPKKYTMYVGDTYKLDYKITPNDATDRSVTWSSNNKVVATIDAYGNVKALKEGTTIITVKSADGNKKAQSTIKVINNPKATTNSNTTDTPKPTNIKTTIALNEHNISLAKGSEYTLKATVTGSNTSVIWSSSDEKIATVENGKVKGISVGTAKITAKVKGTSISDVCEVKVINSGENGVKFDSEELIVYLDKTKDIKLVTTPTDMTIDKKEYTIEDKEVISIEEDTIKGLKLGSTKLTVKVNDKYTAEVKVTVKEEPMTLTISGYSINFSELIYNYDLEIGKEKTLDITSNKDIHVDGNEKLKNKSVITVTNLETSKEYNITIKKKNNATIYFAIITAILAGVCIYTFIRRKKN